MPRRKGVHFTPREAQYLPDLGEVLVMSTPMFKEYFPEDHPKSMLRRLRQLANERIIAPVYEAARSQWEEVYRLTDQGAAWLTYHHGPPRRILHSNPDLRVLPHRLNVATAVRAFRKIRPRPDFLLEYDRVPNAPFNMPHPCQYILAEDWMALPTAAGRPIERYGPSRYENPTITLVKVRPDVGCLLTRPSLPSAFALYMEIDNGTETHTQLLGGGKLPGKLPGYHALLTTRAYRHHWPDHHDVSLQPRVLFIFTSAERRDNVLRRLQKNPTVLWRCPKDYKPTQEDTKRALAFLDGYFRFALLSDLAAPDHITLPIWRTVTGQTNAIDSPRASA